MRLFLTRTAIVGAVLLVAAGGASAQPGAGAQRALQQALKSGIKRAAGATGAYVVDLTSGQTLFATGANTPRMPASVEKLYTTATALVRFGSNGTLTTNVLGAGSIDASGVWHGTLYLKGGGDPTFGSSSFDRYAYGTGATMQRLVANLVRQTGITAVQGRIVGDESYFDSVRGTPTTGGHASTYVEGLLSGLAYDRGLANEQGTAFQTRPALFAAQQFASALRSAGVNVPKRTPVFTGVTPTTAQPLTSVHSPRMATLIRLTNSPSDNYLAEMLLKGIGARFGSGGTTAAGAAVVRSQVLQSFGITPQIVDGSGLSRSDRTSARDIVATLRTMATNPDFVASLSVAGKTGTLQLGLQGTAAQGRCRGKTGSLHDVANEVGYCTARDGHTLAFAFLMNAVDPTLGHSVEDQMTVALAKFSG
jgi:D-alanyl-D-alanine carboxypeptidase/D-alanyl-D-alanine-endopeptidase (penicillin-binding protein 4)